MFRDNLPIVSGEWKARATWKLLFRPEGLGAEGKKNMETTTFSTSWEIRWILKNVQNPA